jgi:ZU5 domain
MDQRWLRAVTGALVLVAVGAVACSSDRTGPAPAAQGTVGPSGGVVEAEGVRLTVPAGALADPVTISITRAASASVDDYDAFSPLFEFGPTGLHFVSPVEVSIAYTDPGDGSKPTVLWSQATGSGYDALASTTSGGQMVAHPDHFSRGFVGRRRAAQGGDGGTPNDGGVGSDAPATDGRVPTDAGGDGATCVPYLGACTQTGDCCNSVPCVLRDGGGICAFSA